MKTRIKNKKKSLLTTLLLSIIPVVTILSIAMQVFLFKVVQRVNVENGRRSCETVVDMNSLLISEKFNSIVNQLNVITNNCMIHNVTDSTCIELLRTLVDKSEGLYAYASYQKTDGTIFSTVATKKKKKDKKVDKSSLDNLASYYISDIYPSELDPNKSVIYVSVPVLKKNGTVKGVIKLAVNAKTISDLVDNISVMGIGSAFVVNEEETRLIFNKTAPEYAMKFCLTDSCDFRELDLIGRKILTGIQQGNGFVYDSKNRESYMAWKKIPKTRWYLLINLSNNEMGARRMMIKNLCITVGLIVFFLTFLFVSMTARRWIVNPLTELRNVVNEFAEGKMFNAAKLKYDVKNEIGQLYDKVATMAQKLITTTTDIHSQSEQIVNNSHELNSTAEHITASMSVQATAVQEISATIEQISSLIAQTASNASHTKTTSENIAHDIGHVAEASDKTLESIKMIINKTKIINEIAKKTDLLAINAAVEAARAGENGRGFSTVATEIKKLAERSKIAADQIDEASKKTLAITEESTQMIEQISPRITENAEKVSEIAVSCIEQKNGAEQINNVIQQLAQISMENSSEAEKLATKAGNFAKYAENLNQSVSFFKTKDEKSETIEKISQQLKEHNEQIETLRDELAECDRREQELKSIRAREIRHLEAEIATISQPIPTVSNNNNDNDIKNNQEK